MRKVKGTIKGSWGSETSISGKPFPSLGLEGQVSPGRAGALEEPLLRSFPGRAVVIPTEVGREWS